MTNELREGDIGAELYYQIREDLEGPITAATNASPIVITSADHNLANGDSVTVVGVKGNTAANGDWTVANETTDTFELSGSTGNAAFMAGQGTWRCKRPSDLTGATVTLFLEQRDGTTVERSATLLDAANGIIIYSTVSGDLEYGQMAVMGKIVQSGNTFHSTFDIIDVKRKLET